MDSRFGLAELENAAHILAALAEGGVQTLWFISGSDLTALQEARAILSARDLPTPEFRQALHEHVALSVAMGQHLMSNGPVAVAAHADLGILNCGGALHNAAVGNYPVFLMSGSAPTVANLRTIPVYWTQERFDQRAALRPYMKWDHTFTTYESCADLVARALQVAQSSPAGPVYCALPVEVARSVASSGSGSSLRGPLTLPTLGAGPSEQLDEVAERLLSATRPLIVTDRIGRLPGGAAALQVLAEEFGIGVAATRHRMNLSDDSACGYPTYGISEADCLLAIEQRVPWIPVKGRPPTGCWKAAVSKDPTDAVTPSATFDMEELIQADAVAFLRSLIERMRSRVSSDQRERGAARLAAFEARQLSAHAATHALWEQPGPIDPRLVGVGLSEVLEPDDVFTWELADATTVRRSQPDSMFESGGSSLGWAVAAAIGARYQDPSRPAIALCGDGSYLFGQPTALLWQQTYLEAPVLAVIANNGGYRTGTTRLKDDYPNGVSVRNDDYTGGLLDPPVDIANLARSMGGEGFVVESAAELVPSLRQARKVVEAEHRPAVVDVRIQPLVGARRDA